MSVEIRAADPEAQPGAGLRADMVAEIVDLYGRSDGHERGYGVTPEQLRPPEGERLLLWEDGSDRASPGIRAQAAARGGSRREITRETPLPAMETP